MLCTHCIDTSRSILCLFLRQFASLTDSIFYTCYPPVQSKSDKIPLNYYNELWVMFAEFLQIFKVGKKNYFPAGECAMSAVPVGSGNGSNRSKRSRCITGYGSVNSASRKAGVSGRKTASPHDYGIRQNLGTVAALCPGKGKMVASRGTVKPE